MSINVGIDLGTTYSSVAVWDNATKQVKVLENSDNNVCTPSVTHIENGIVKIGEEAKHLQAQGDLNSAAFYKSMMGEQGYTLYLDGKEYTPEELSGLYLRELIQNISKHNNVKIDGAVITCPAYFNEHQRLATQNAGKKAGLNVLKIINEPTSAILAYGLTGTGKKTVMVYDLGGGTFDVTIAEVNGTSVTELVTNGNHQLGGKNWDAVIAEELKQLFFSEFNINIEDNQEDFYQLKVECEKLKKSLTDISAKVVTVQSGGYTGKYEITRKFFDDATYSLLNETKLLIEKCFTELGGGFGWKDLSEVVLVGGSTRMPQVKEFVSREYGRPPVTKNINVDTIVSVGAAIQAKLCVEGRLVLPGGVVTAGDIKAITSHSLGTLVISADNTTFINEIIIKKNSPYNKTEESAEFAFTGEKMDVYVLQGESAEPRDCKLLYRYSVTGFAKGQETKFTLLYVYNQNGVVEVSIKPKDGSNLKIEKTIVDETIEEVIERLLKVNVWVNPKICVSSPGCDDMGSILQTLELGFDHFKRGGFNCEMLFLNCLTEDTIDERQLRAFVQNGGCLYASCYMDDTINTAFPGVFNFGGHIGNPMKHMTVDVLDTELQPYIGKQINVTFDTQWAVLNSVPKGEVILRAAASTDRAYAGKPIMVKVQYGKGYIFFTSFHNYVNATEKEKNILQILLFKQISTVKGSSVPMAIEKIGKGKILGC